MPEKKWWGCIYAAAIACVLLCSKKTCEDLFCIIVNAAAAPSTLSQLHAYCLLRKTCDEAHGSDAVGYLHMVALNDQFSTEHFDAFMALTRKHV